MANSVNDSLFLKEVFLSGYKSIINVNIELQKGLNVIIGKNAAGKTNFLKFLSKNLLLDYNELNNFSSNLTFQNGAEISLKTSRDIEIEELFKQSTLSANVNSVLTISKKIIEDTKEKATTISEKLIENKVVFGCTFLCHGIPNEYFIVDIPFSFKVEKKRISSELSKLISDTKVPYFISCLAIDLVSETYSLQITDINKIKESLNNIFKKIESLNNILKKHSPIQGVRFSNNFNIFVDEEKESFTINNLFLEFKINGSWLPFSNLSDGTKRLFYIISEVFENETVTNLSTSNNGKFYPISEISRIILIEEPELGIHPHQFHKLMEFLNEESENKQIIVSTHSPQALDAIKPNELDRIIIAYSTHSEEGTKLRHLNEDELIKANEYIKEDFLSDYWLYSDLEN